MAENTEISWARATFNPWIGCTKISAACAHCYAERQDQFRSWTPDGWGEGKPRRRTSVANWQQPIRWNRAAEVSGERWRVFSASLADWLDPEVPREWQADFLDLVRLTPSLDWLRLSKRLIEFDSILNGVKKIAKQENRGELFNFLYGWQEDTPPQNVWLGATVENQDRAVPQIPLLLSIPARVHWLSVEPLLGPLSLTNLAGLHGTHNVLSGEVKFGAEVLHVHPRKIDWVIVGGESGPDARPLNPAWVERLRRECSEHGTAFHFKQHGEWMPVEVGKEREAWGYEIPCPALHHVFADGNDVVKVGKKDAGRLLLVDGELRTFDEFPEVTR